MEVIETIMTREGTFRFVVDRSGKAHMETFFNNSAWNYPLTLNDVKKMRMALREVSRRMKGEGRT